jgi:Taurine catabolism dioxygenase TauD, TfdA family
VSDIPLSAVDSPAAWLAADLAADRQWERAFTSAEVATLHDAFNHLCEVNPSLDLATMTADDFPLAELAPELARLRDVIVDGVGTQVYTGFPVEHYTEQELRAIWWGFNLHVGTAVSQSWRGNLIGDVRDVGTGIAGRAGRGYTSNDELNFHSDFSDLTGLFFLKQGKTGGVSRMGSSVAVHNEIYRRRPDLLAVLYEPFATSWQSNELPGEQPWYNMPIFGRDGDNLSCAFVKTNVLWAAKNCGAPPMTDRQIDAVEYLAAVAAEDQFLVERRFEPGTMWFCSNHTVLHMRTAFTDFDEPERKRHLLRIWLSLPNGHALSPTYAPFFGDVRAGAVRGGYRPRPNERVSTIDDRANSDRADI